MEIVNCVLSSNFREFLSVGSKKSTRATLLEVCLGGSRFLFGGRDSSIHRENGDLDGRVGPWGAGVTKQRGRWMWASWMGKRHGMHHSLAWLMVSIERITPIRLAECAHSISYRPRTASGGERAGLTGRRRDGREALQEPGVTTVYAFLIAHPLYEFVTNSFW